MDNQNAIIVNENTTIDVERIKALKNSLMPPNTSNSDFELFIEYCKKTKLDPFSRQIYALKGDNKLSIQTSIDGFRVIAQRTGEYQGQEVFWCDDDGVWKDVWLSENPPKASKVLVYRKNLTKPVSAVAVFREYSRSTPIWKKMPALMLAKCAEALALRKAFPNELSGLYTSDEMDQANDNKSESVKNTIDNCVYDEKTDTYIIPENQYDFVPSNNKYKGKKWSDLEINTLLGAKEHYTKTKPDVNYANKIQSALEEKLSICPLGAFKGSKWEELSTEELKKYYEDYQSGRLTGYAKEYMEIIESILLEREHNTNKIVEEVKVEVVEEPKVEVSEDDDPFSKANDSNWDSDSNWYDAELSEEEKIYNEEEATSLSNDEETDTFIMQ